MASIEAGKRRSGEAEEKKSGKKSKVKIKELIKNMSFLLAERFLNDDKVLVLLDEYVNFWINYAKKSK